MGVMRKENKEGYFRDGRRSEKEKWGGERNGVWREIFGVYLKAPICRVFKSFLTNLTLGMPQDSKGSLINIYTWYFSNCIYYSTLR